jgi:hypothetical protein
MGDASGLFTLYGARCSVIGYRHDETNTARYWLCGARVDDAHFADSFGCHCRRCDRQPISAQTAQVKMTHEYEVRPRKDHRGVDLSAAIRSALV